MKRSRNNPMKTCCRVALQCLGLLVLLAGTTAAQKGQSVDDARRPTTTLKDDSVVGQAATNVYSSPAAAGQRILFSVDLVSVGEPSLKGWFQQHSKEPVRLFPGPIGKASPIQLPAAARLSLLTQLNRDAESSVLASPALVTSWSRGASYSIGDFGEDDSFFSLRLTPEEVGGREIALKVRTQLRPKADDETITGPKDLSWDVRGPLGNAFLFPVADVASGKKLILIVRPSIAAGGVAPQFPAPSGLTRRPTAVAQLPATRSAGFVAVPPDTQGVARPSGLPTVGPSVTKEAAVLQMLVLDVDSKIANEVLSRTTTVEGTLDKVGESKKWKGAGGKRETGSRNFSLTSIPGMMFVADLKAKDESFKIVARPQVRTLIDVAAALEVRGRKTPEQQVAGFGTLRIFVTPRKVNDDLAVQTHFTLSQVGKASLKTEGQSKPTYEAEATVKTSPGTTSVMMLEADSTDRTILLLTDVVSIQKVEVPGQPSVASYPPAMPSEQPRRAFPSPSVSQPQSVAQLTPLAPVRQASGVQQSLPQVSPKSEVQQVLDEVREMRKLIQGLRDDMSRLRESVTRPERRTSQSDVWIQQGDSHVFTRGKKIRSVTAHNPEIVNVTVLAADSLRLTGVSPGRTTLKCLFEGESSPKVFLVEVIALPKQSGAAPLRQQALVPRAADHLPGQKRPYKVRPPGSGQVALPNIPKTDVRIYENHVELIKRDKAISRIAVGAPAIVDVTQYSATEFGITGRRPGSTTVLFWLDSSEEPERMVIEVFPARQVASERFHSAVSPESAAAREQIEQALSKATSINIDDGTLLDALRSLQESAGVNVAVDSRALEEEGVSPDAKVSLHVTGVSLRSVLNLLLNEHNLAVLIEDEVLKVTSRQRAEGKQTVVAYHVDDLVDSGVREPGSFDELSSLITTLVRPESWQDVGGNGSVAANLPTRTLVIRQTQMAHKEIQQLFTALLKWKKSASTGPVSSAPMAIGVDELDGGHFSGFSPIEYSDPPFGAPNLPGRPISPVGDAVLEAVEPPGTTGAPIEAR